jgi:hypothetical protein
MTDNPQVILNRFQEYAKKFESLQPAQVLSFYHYPAILIAPDKTEAIKNQIEGFFAFWKVMGDLKRRNYHHSHIKSLSVRYLSNNLAMITGMVIRCRKDNTELERFCLTYTLRHVDGNWQIIVGALHDVSI